MLDSPSYWFANVREPLTLFGRWVGAGAAAPTPVANTTRPTGPGAPQGAPITIVRNGVGNLTVTLPSPVGVVQSYDFWICSGANNKACLVAPPAVGANSFTVLVEYAANGVAVDVAATEELLMEVTSSIAVRP